MRRVRLRSQLVGLLPPKDETAAGGAKKTRGKTVKSEATAKEDESDGGLADIPEMGDVRLLRLPTRVRSKHRSYPRLRHISASRPHKFPIGWLLHWDLFLITSVI